jgi:hypothetical protein
MHYAAMAGNPQCVDFLHNVNVPVGLLDNDGLSALHLAIQYSRVACVEMLVEELGADANLPDSKGNTPAHHAVLANSADALAVLVDAGADLSRLNNEKQTPLQLAVARNSKETLDLLQERSADHSTDGALATVAAAAAQATRIAEPTSPAVNGQTQTEPKQTQTPQTPQSQQRDIVIASPEAPAAKPVTPVTQPPVANSHRPTDEERMKTLGLTDAALKRMLPTNVVRTEALDVITRFRSMDKDGR